MDKPQAFDPDEFFRERATSPKAANGAGQHLPLIPFRDLRPSTARNYIVKGIFPRTGIAVVWGPPKCGKSFWCFDLFMHVALDWPYRGRRISQGPVVYCAFEGADGINYRAEAFRMAHPEAREIDPPFYLMPSRLDMIRNHGLLLDTIRDLDPRPVAVVLDTLNKSLVGSESKDEDMAKYIFAADAVREAFNCLVIIVHHCGVSGDRPRGHSSLTAAADAQIAVVKEEGVVIATVEHMKDSPDGAKLQSKLESVTVVIDDDGEPVTSCFVRVCNEDEQVATPEPEKKDRLTRSEALLLRALNEELADRGRDPPPGRTIPRGVKVVTEREWRTRSYQTQIADGAQNAKRMAFKRGSEGLLLKGKIGVHDATETTGECWVWTA